MFDDAPPAFAPVPHHELEDLLDALRNRLDELDGEQLQPEDVDAAASKLGLNRAHAWIATAFDPALTPDPSDDEIKVGICVGRCQLQGAIVNLEKLLEVQDDRKEAGKPPFAISPRQCLDRCPHGPVAICDTPHGQAGVPRMNPNQVPELIDELFALGD